MKTKTRTPDINQTWSESNSIANSQELFSAVTNKRFDKLKSLLMHADCNVNIIDETSNTPLNVALATGNLEAASMLLAKGTDINIANRKGLTALHTLIKNIEYYVDENILTHQILDLAKKLITSGAQLNAQERRGNTIINCVAQKAKVSQPTTDLYTTIGLLVLSSDKDAEQNVKIKNNMGKTPLDYLSRNGNDKLRDAVYNTLPQGRAHMKRMEQKREHIS